MPDGIACAGRCEAAAQAAGRLWAKSESLNRMAGYFLLTLGLAFTAFAVYLGASYGADSSMLIPAVFGLTFLVYGGAMVLRLSTKRTS